MDARFYSSEDIDIERLASDLVTAYLAQGFKAQQIGTKDQMLVQLKKGGDFEAIIGMQAALSLTLQRTAGGVLAMIGQQRWIDKAAVGAVGIAVLPVLWPLAVTAGVGALRQASLGNQVLNMVDGLVRQQRPGISIGPIPSQVVPQIQQQWSPPPYSPTPAYVPPAQVVISQEPRPALPPPMPMPTPPAASSGLRCSNCNTPYEPGDTFCTGCGKPLSAPKLYCPNCHSELKPGIAFCPKCGASTFSTVSASQQTQPKPAPAPAPTTITYVQQAPAAPAPVQERPQTPVYTPPPTPPTPVYTPPPAPPAPAPAPVFKPPTPVYTPPTPPTPPPAPAYTPPVTSTPANPPAPQVYYIPSAQTAAANDAPTVAEPTPKKPEEPYYVPPVTQEPTIKPQPKVTIVPSEPKQAPPPPKQQPQPQKQYYIPSNPNQETMPAAQAASPASATQGQTGTGAAKPITARPATGPVANANTPWGTLTFSNGEQMQLSGERAVVGRYDHDLGGIQPEVDLGRMQGADTVSRVHAAIEHVGSSYTLTDLNSTNATRLNNKRLEPDKATPINDGDTLQFGKVTCTFKKAS